jgi:hypothetical protein
MDKAALRDLLALVGEGCPACKRKTDFIAAVM